MEGDGPASHVSSEIPSMSGGWPGYVIDKTRDLGSVVPPFFSYPLCVWHSVSRTEICSVHFLGVEAGLVYVFGVRKFIQFGGNDRDLGVIIFQLKRLCTWKEK